MTRIAVDAMGGDYMPDCNVDGALKAISETEDVEVTEYETHEQIKNIPVAI